MVDPEYAEIKAEPIKKEQLHPRRMRRFINHLSSATIKARERSEKKQQIKAKIEKVKSVSLNKRSTKKMIESELGDFEDVVHDIIHDEEKILEEQRKETKQIAELKTMVENLSKKLIEIGRDYAKEMEQKDDKILELRESLASANIKISETGDERQKKIDLIEKKLKSKTKSAKDNVGDIESHLSMLEQRHKDLKKTGKHTKKDLDRVKKMIDTHKDKLKTVKAKKK